MKKIVKRIFLVLLAVVTVYTAVTTVLIHGVSVYRMNSQLGAVLAVSRQVTFLAAIVLWIAALVLIWRWSSAKRKKSKLTAAAADASVPLNPAGAKKKPRKLFGKPEAAADKIPPRRATKPMPNNEAEGSIPPKRGTMPMPAGKSNGSSTGSTMPMPAAEPAGPSTGPTMPMPAAESAGSPTGPTMPMPANKPAASMTSPTMPMPKENFPGSDDMVFSFEKESWTISNTTLKKENAESPVFNEPKQKQPTSGIICPKCGSMVRAGAKFCTKCGCRLEAEV